MNIGEKHENLRRFTAMALLAAIASGVPAANDQTNDQPLTEKWAPSVWGPEDLVGSVNWTTPETVLKGVEHVARIGFVCRAVLLDAVALRGATLPIPTAVDAAEHDIVGEDHAVAHLAAVGQE